MEKESAAPPFPRGLYALCDDGLRPELGLAEKAARLLDGGVRVLQLRMKRTRGREALAAAERVWALCERAGATCLVNDRVDLALLTGASGVHLGEDDLPPAAARRLLGPGRVIGVTVRSLAGAVAAREASADYVGLGPIFPSRTKPLEAPALGLEGLRAIAAESPLPIVAISGIGLENVGAVAAAGAHGAAVAGALLLADDLAAAARALARAFEGFRVP